ncbi:MAG TPA: FtsX-like permease family protein, partial [Myxococcota bacterium]|nr:FtsX-like permease family protein [Myxococcota bacterium]
MDPTIRDMPLSIRLFWRTLRGPEGWLAILTVLSIASSVALTTAMEMSSRSAGLQVEQTARAMIGSAKLEISAGSVGVAEHVLDDVRAEQGVLAASPMMSARVFLAEQRLVINVIGLDFLADEQVRPNSVSRHGVQIRDPLLLLAQPNSIVVTQQLLRRLGLEASWQRGESPKLQVRAAGTPAELSVEGILNAGGIAAAFGGQVAVADVYALQKLMNRQGWFDRIDVVPQPGQDVDALASRLSTRLSGVATVRPSTTRSQFFEEVLYVLRIGVFIIAAAGIAVSGLLTYASMMQWVDHQRRQLATLRAVGMGAGRVQRRVFFEASLLASIGTFLGVGGGLLLARPVFARISAFSAFPSGENLVELSARPFTFVLAVVVGLSCALAGSVAPARRAGKRFLVDSLDVDLHTRTVASRAFILPGVLLVLAAASFFHWLFHPPAVFRLAALFASSLAFLISLTPSYPSLLRSTLSWVQQPYPRLANMVGRGLCARPLSFAVAVTAFAGLLAALICTALMLASMEDASDDWINARYPDATFITAGPPLDGERQELLTAETMRAIRATPGVSAIDEQYWFGRTMLFRGEEVPIIAQTMSVVASKGDMTSVGQSPFELAKKLEAGGIAVSVQFAKRFGVNVGDELTLDSSQGPVRLPVEGLFKDFGGTVGLLLMDLRIFDLHWNRAGAWGAVVWIDGEKGPVIDAIRSRVSSQDLFFTDTTELRRLNREQLARLTDVVSAVGGLLALLGGFSVTILLIGVIAERRRDFALLRASGLDRGSLVRLVLADAAVIGVIASLAGFGMGVLCARPWMDILRETYGWVVE